MVAGNNQATVKIKLNSMAKLGKAATKVLSQAIPRDTSEGYGDMPRCIGKCLGKEI
jgi:hypothetical protein